MHNQTDTLDHSKRTLCDRVLVRRCLTRLMIGAMLIATFAAAPRRASAQFLAGYGGGYLPYGNGGYGSRGYGGRGYGGRMPGTALSAAQFGMARMIAASGYANMMNSQATRNYLAARSQDFQNRAQWTNNYYAMRREHRAYDDGQTRLSMDELTKIAENAAPQRLDATQFAAETGKIHWPVILQDTRYIEACDELENLFQSRTKTTGTTSAEAYRDINQACDRLLKLLKSNINDYQPNDFESAKHFIDSLRREAQLPTT